MDEALVQTGSAPTVTPQYDLNADTGELTPVDAPKLTEREKYELMWSRKEYRGVAPGEWAAVPFMEIARPRPDAQIIDFGAGTGRGAQMLCIQGQNFRVHMVDFAANCLDDAVREWMENHPDRLTFTQCDLTSKIPLVAEYGYCTDVMEHIPPDAVDQVLLNILSSAQHVFFQISTEQDSCGKLIGEELHLSVHEPAWWLAKFNAFKCQIHYWQQVEGYCCAYVTAWSTGKEVTDIGVLNTAEDKIRENVRANLAAGWQQVKPYEPNNLEMMIVGGGPSLNGQLEEIRRLRAEGVKLVTLNGAYNWALENGLTPSATIVVDAREFNARFTHPVVDQTLYLIGSQCDPKTLEGLPKERTWLWHTTAEVIRDILEEVCPGEWFGVFGGSTVLLRAIPLLRMLGYAKFHLFGCDSCSAVNTEAQDGTVLGTNSPFLQHAYSQPENDGDPVFPVVLGGRRFDCTTWQSSQASEFMDLIRVFGNEFQLEVHGDGLLRWILEHAADIDTENEIKTELERRRSLPGLMR